MSPNSELPVRNSRSWWVTVVLLAVAGMLWLSPPSFHNPVRPASDVPAWATDTTPVRQPTMVPSYTSGVYTYRCSDCHKILPSPPETHAHVDAAH